MTSRRLSLSPNPSSLKDNLSRSEENYASYSTGKTDSSVNYVFVEYIDLKKLPLFASLSTTLRSTNRKTPVSTIITSSKQTAYFFIDKLITLQRCMLIRQKGVQNSYLVLFASQDISFLQNDHNNSQPSSSNLENDISTFGLYAVQLDLEKLYKVIKSSKSSNDLAAKQSNARFDSMISECIASGLRLRGLDHVKNSGPGMTTFSTIVPGKTNSHTSFNGGDSGGVYNRSSALSHLPLSSSQVSLNRSLSQSFTGNSFDSKLSHNNHKEAEYIKNLKDITFKATKFALSNTKLNDPGNAVEAVHQNVNAESNKKDMNDENIEPNAHGETLTETLDETLEEKIPASAHLYVLLHGMWGSDKHMFTIRDQLLVQDPDCTVFIPCKNGFFKTFDGIELIGDRVIDEIKLFLLENSATKKKNQKEGADGELQSNSNTNPTTFTHISFISYSMGGVVARYCLGHMHDFLSNELNLQLQVFATFATPHMGINFYKPYFPFTLLTYLGSTLLGRSGRQLFLNDNRSKSEENRLLLKISKGKYLQALSKFKYKVTFANSQHDRTVAFYTAFITDKSFGCDGETFETGFAEIENFPASSVLDVTKTPVSDLNDLNKSPARLFFSKFAQIVKLIGRILVFTLLFLIFFPIMLLVNITGTIYSYSRIRKVLKTLDSEDPERQSLQEEFQDLESDWEVYGSDGYSQDGNSSFAKQCDYNMEAFITKYSKNEKNYAHDIEKLPFDHARKVIFQNLNSLKWIRVPLSLKAMNAHRAIVARSGMKTLAKEDADALLFNMKLIAYLSERH
ncbi:hypothetical protein ACO0QE_004722 [Hanseniaspora vineae]